MLQGRIAVLDVGKTLAKLTIWSADGRLEDRHVRPNARAVSDDGYPCLDVAGIDAWLAETLRAVTEKGQISAIVPVGHGAAACIVDGDTLRLAPLDYEAELPAETRAAYLAQRDSFARTGSPALPAGLNLGAQLHWLEAIAPQKARSGVILTWPQFWAWRLCGVAAAEITSLGCHTDLWLPVEGCPSPMAVARGWAGRLAPLRRAADGLGPVTEEWQKRGGLRENCMVLCGLHDSNAALLAARGHAETRGRDCTVLSTGTWFVAMHSAAARTKLDLSSFPEARDCLVNVDVHGNPVPSARFMGGREAEMLEQAAAAPIDPKACEAALLDLARRMVERGVMALPAFQKGVGPFPESEGRWTDRPADQMARRAVAGLYLALMADTSLALIGSTDSLVIEGRFADDPVFTRALASLRPRQNIYLSHAHDSVPYGALRLIDPDLPPHAALLRTSPLPFDLSFYTAQWRSRTLTTDTIV